ncbi:MAG: hypothetical protein U0L79_05755 [Lachnospiraceae bacterium]|nr:hypothetical protein [Lachnospiraceae bacterium]
MGRTKGEKAVKRAEKRAEMERKKAIQEANKMLIPTPKQTAESLGILSFDPSGAFRLTGNRWMRVYEIRQMQTTESDLFAEMIRELKGRVRITARIGSKSQDKTFLTVMEEGEIYGDVRKDIEKDQEALSKVFLLKPLTVDETMMEVMGDGRKPFSYASMVRGKKNWKSECFPVFKPEAGSVKVNDSYGESMIIMQYPSNLSINPFRSLCDIGCLMYVSLDLRGISLKQSFTQALEQRYNRRISAGKSDEFANASVSIFFSCDSDDARAIIEKTLITMFSNCGFALAPTFGAQEKAAESVIGLGITDYSVMRNVDMDVVSDLVMYGGGLCQ